MLIGVTGLAQHGKDTVGRYLVENYGFQRFAFADTLKSMALALDPWVVYMGTDAITEVVPEPLRLSWLVDAIGWEQAKRNTEVRRFLQVLGTEGVRDHLGENTWVQAVQDQLVQADVLEDAVGYGIYSGSKHGVITDTRFPNEAEFVRQFGTLVRVFRPNFDNGLDQSHPSERSVMSLQADFTLVNDGTVQDLYAQVDDYMAQMGVRWAAKSV